MLEILFWRCTLSVANRFGKYALIWIVYAATLSACSQFDILENSSFIVSSSFADKKLWGNGFVARLSGSTAEFLQIWLIMNLGNNPFRMNQNNELTLTFSPSLAGWLFDKKNKSYGFNFLSSIKIIYHNPKLKDTFGKTGCSIKKISFNDKDNRLVELSSGTIPSPYAQQIRARQVKQIDIYLE